jgi:DNA primase
LLEIHDRVARSIYIQYLAERLNVNETAIAEKLKSGEKKVRRAMAGNPLFPAQSQPPVEDNPHFVDSEMIKIERQIVSMMINSPEILPEIKKRNVLARFSDKRLCEIAELVLEHPVYGKEDLSRLMNRLTSSAHKDMIASLVIKDECRDLNQCAQLLSQFMNSIEKRQNSLLSQIKSAQESNDESLLVELLRKKQEQSVNRLR